MKHIEQILKREYNINKIGSINTRNWLSWGQITYYIASNQEGYILKEFSKNCLGKVEAFCAIHPFLLKEGFFLNYHIFTKGGKGFAKDKNGYYLLTRIRSGAEHIRIFSFNLFFKIGMFMGRYHNTMDKFVIINNIPRSSNFVKRVVFDLYDTLDQIISENLAAQRFLSQRAFKKSFEKFEKEIYCLESYDDSAWTVIHAEFSLYNIMILDHDFLIYDYHSMFNSPKILDVVQMFISILVNAEILSIEFVLKMFSRLVLGYNFVSSYRIDNHAIKVAIETAFFYTLRDFKNLKKTLAYNRDVYRYLRVIKILIDLEKNNKLFKL